MKILKYKELEIHQKVKVLKRLETILILFLAVMLFAALFMLYNS